MKTYAKTHEWVEELGEDVVRIGISDYAQGQLGDIVFINLPNVGDKLNVGDSFADVESVKAVSDLYAPVSGVVKAVNEELLDQPELLNQAAENTWIIEVSDVSSRAETMSLADYLASVE